VNNQHWKKSKLWRRLRPRRDELETTKVYTEEEIQSLAHSQKHGSGIIRLNTGDLHLPKGLEEPAGSGKIDSATKVMLVIITLAVLFICIITYFVNQMPNKV
jgi:hypothetical protein